MGTKRGAGPAVEATVGYAADERGYGLAYARLTGEHARRVLRVGFTCQSPTPERGVAYAALTAVTRALGRRGFGNVRFVVRDREFVDEIATGRGVADTLALAYVRLRCALNALAAFAVRTGDTDELTQRARAEVTLNVAA
jgi:hypothetical protein